MADSPAEPGEPRPRDGQKAGGLLCGIGGRRLLSVVGLPRGSRSQVVAGYPLHDRLDRQADQVDEGNRPVELFRRVPSNGTGNRGQETYPIGCGGFSPFRLTQGVTRLQVPPGYLIGADRRQPCENLGAVGFVQLVT